MRSHYCGLIDRKLLGQTVHLCGWVHRRRDHGGVIFIDLRDREGLVQIVCDPDRAETFATANGLRNEFVVRVEGRVRERPAGTTNASGDNISALFGDPVIAKGKGVEVKRSQLDAAMIGVRAGLKARGQTVNPDQMIGIERQVLNDIISLQLLLAKATPADKAKGQELFDKAIQRLKTDGKLTDAEFDEKLATQLRIQGLTREEWNKQRLDQAIAAVDLADAGLREGIYHACRFFYEEEMPQAACWLDIVAAPRGAVAEIPEAAFG